MTFEELRASDEYQELVQENKELQEQKEKLEGDVYDLNHKLEALKKKIQDLWYAID